MTVFGITGGSGSGKTTAARLLSERGVTVIDADVIAHAVTEREPCLSELTAYFGKGILRSDGSLDRRALADLAFADSESAAALNRITHKYIKAETEVRIKKAKTPLVAVDGAVIIGSPVEPQCGFIVSVLADRDTRINRITARDGITAERAAARLDAQPSDGFYKKNSLYIIYNNGAADELEKQIDALLKSIKEKCIE